MRIAKRDSRHLGPKGFYISPLAVGISYSETTTPTVSPRRMKAERIGYNMGGKRRGIEIILRNLKGSLLSDRKEYP